MKFVAISLSVFAAATAIVIGCSSSSSSSSSCIPSMGASNSTSCSSCAESSCGSEVSAVESACSAFLSCAQACGCTTESCLTSCESNLTAGSCESAGASLYSCEQSKCKSACSATGIPDGGSGSPDSGGGNSVTVSCITSAAKDECDAVTFSGADVAEASAQKTGCTQRKGTVVASCPTEKLVGCCTVAVSGISTDSCFYTGTVSSQTSACKAAGGTFSTKI